MSHRTQITLEDRQYERLRAESCQSGLGLAELIRRAVDQVYGGAGREAFANALNESFGAWDAGGPDGEQFVESIRPARSDRFAQ